MKKVALLLRVGTEKQQKGLEDQLKQLNAFCEHNDLQVVHVIREIGSANSTERTDYQNWIELMKSGKLECEELLFTSWDRFSRNFQASLEMIRALKELNVRARSIQDSENLYASLTLFELMMSSEFESLEKNRRSIRSKAALRHHKQQGYWAQRPPFGYTSSPDRIIKPDKATSWVIPFVFEKFALGEDQKSIREELEKKGVQLSKSLLEKSLRNPVYAGMILIPAFKDQKQSITEGKHEPLISVELYNRAQIVLNKKQ